MLFNWIYQGLKSGIRSSRYPRGKDESPGVTPGRPIKTRLAVPAAGKLAALCPTGAIATRVDGADVDYRRCVHCARCRGEQTGAAMDWSRDFEWAYNNADAKAVQRRLHSIFGRSLHIRFLDAGACGACMSEARQLNNPYYNIHRLGFFITPTPRQADILLVAGPVTDAMRVPLQKAYEAMPAPKRVVAMGVCAISGGVFAPSFISDGGVGQVIPVDVSVPGCPPPPLAILHALLLAVERSATQNQGAIA